MSFILEDNMGSSLNYGPFLGPNIVRHPYKKDPKRDPNLENYPYVYHTYSLHCSSFFGLTNSILRIL